MGDSSRIGDIRFDTAPSYTGGTVADVFPPGQHRPGALKSFVGWPRELQATTATQNAKSRTDRIIFKGAGESRLVYVSEDGLKAFKIADATGRYTKDDNREEVNAVVPAWLVPRVCGFVEQVHFQGVCVSVLIVQACSDTLSTLGKISLGEESIQGRLLRSRTLRFRANLVQELHPRTLICLFVQSEAPYSPTREVDG